MTKVLTNASAIRDHVRKLKPNRIAVAYVGTDWRRFVVVDALQEIVLSPTLGSNPWAIEEIIRAIGIRNVYFLDELHAKFYLAGRRAFVGSANLSNNAFLDDALVEAGVALDDEASLGQLRRAFEEYKELAGKQYPDEEAKRKRLLKLHAQRSRAEWAEVIIPRRSPALTDYVQERDRIHVTWYDDGEHVTTNTRLVNQHVPAVSNADLDDRFERELYFHAADDLQEGDWLLCWPLGPGNRPKPRGEIYWMRAHHVIPKGVLNNDYSTLVVQIRGRPRGSLPFKLDDATKAAIRSVLMQDRFRALRSTNQSVWRLAEADRLTPSFLEQVKVVLRDGRVSERI